MGTVLGVMARAPIPGSCKTRLVEHMGAEGAAQLYEAMLRDSLALFARAGAARLVVMAAPEDDGPRALRALAGSPWEIVAQHGVSLGERLQNAMRSLGANGDPVVLVSSDAPTVALGPLKEALGQFSGARRALLGPCEDGGYYLVGLTTPELGIFDDIPWSTPNVLARTRRRCIELGLALRELPTGYDVDEPEDVKRLAREVLADRELAPHVAGFFSRGRAELP